MKSKVTYDFDGLMKPVIRATVAYGTDDVRDKLARTFIENLGYDSNLCTIHNEGVGESDSHYVIRPVKDVYEAVIEELSKLSPNYRDSITDYINGLRIRKA